MESSIDRTEHNTYNPVWAKKEDFEEILLTKSFFIDHHANRVAKALRQVAEESFGLVSPFYLDATSESCEIPQSVQ